MARNSQSRFSVNPTNLNIERSRFPRPSEVKFSFNTGELIPFYLDEVLPGDTFRIRTSKVVRLQSLITPMMDNLYLDTYYFFVPNRLCWEHWREFMGENTASAWVPEVEYEIPQIEAPSGGWNIGTIADYMGIPTGVEDISVSALPFRAYSLICNDWFRSEALSDPINIPLTDATATGSNGSTWITDLPYGGTPYVAAKMHDYFTSCLPSPQAGADTLLPGSGGDPMPVVALPTTHSLPEDDDGIFYPVHGQMYNKFSGGIKSDAYWWSSSPTSTTQGDAAMYAQRDGTYGTSYRYTPDNLYAVADTSGQSTINQLRLAFQVQRFLEKNARGGQRYIELIKSHFGVTSPDARLQRPEYLGGNRIPINVNQLLQQSESTSTSPQGNPVGVSLTTDVHGDFTKSFTEHGHIIGIVVARYNHTYQQGIERLWSRKTKYDYYWPVFAHIGEQSVKNREIFAQGTADDDEVFGYQEAWAEYRYKPSRVAGEMRSAATLSLDVWHLGDDYASLPTLSDGWIREDKSNVDRVLAVQSSTSNQLFADVLVDATVTRAMPLYSVPGMLDHF